MNKADGSIGQHAFAGVDESSRKHRFARYRSWRTLILLAALAFAAYMLIPQFGEIRRAIHFLSSAQWTWVAAAVVASSFTYVGAALTLMAASPTRLRFDRTFVVAVATSFANQFAPFGLGGDAVNVRYLERRGQPRETAVGVVAATLAASVLLHVFSLVVAVIWLGISARALRHALPSGLTALIVGGVLTLGVIAGFVVVRRRPDLLERARDGVRSVAEVLRRPGRATLLAVGQVTLIVGYIAALGFSIYAFGAHPSPVLIAATYLGGTAVGSTSPTPSGLGVVEAAFVGALVVGGVPTIPAIAGVLCFRLVTLWLPALVGWGAYRLLVRKKLL